MRKKITPKAILIPTLSLFLICAVVTALLAVTNSVTAEKIAANEAQSKQESMRKVLPDATDFTPVFEDSTDYEIYLGSYAVDDATNASIGFAISTAASGYGGQVKVMTGFDLEGNIIGVDVFYNDDETPGLGKNTSNESFTDQYKGLTSAGDIVVSKDATTENSQTIDAVTSATISSRAVTAAVNEACEIYNEKCAGFLELAASVSGGVDDTEAAGKEAE